MKSFYFQKSEKKKQQTYTYIMILVKFSTAETYS